MTTTYQKHLSAASHNGSFRRQADTDKPKLSEAETTALVTKQVTEAKDRFNRYIYMLGWRNSKGSKRYDFEVEFCYALHEVERGFSAMRLKHADRLMNIVNRAAEHAKAMEASGKKPGPRDE